MSDFDGSSWAHFTPMPGPPEGPPEPDPQPEAWSSPVECCRRRATFTQGKPFLDARGGLWYLPTLGPESYDRFGSIRGLMEATQAEADAGCSHGMGGSPEQHRQGVVVLAELLAANYEADAEAIGSALGDDPVRTAAFGLVTMMAAIMEHFDHYTAAFLADRNGWTRSDAMAMLRSPIPPCPGWLDHDGPIFNN